MIVPPRIYADFQNADALGRVRLNTAGTLHDLSRLRVQLREGLELTIYSDDADEAGHSIELVVGGIATYSTAENCWLAVIDWETIRHESAVPAAAEFDQSPAPVSPKDASPYSPQSHPAT